MDKILQRLNEIKAEAELALKDLTGSERVEKLEALKTERAELLAQRQEILDAEAIAAELSEGAPEDEKEEEPAEEVEEAPAEVEAPAEEVADEVEAPADAEALALAASAAATVDNDSPDAADYSPIVLTAAGNVGGTSPGVKITAADMARIHRHSSGNKPSQGETVRSIFATMSAGTPADVRMPSETYSAEANTAIMAAGIEPGKRRPLTAAAAFCGPEDIILDICSSGVTARPVQDLFRTVPVRGEFKYMKSATLADVDDGINQWEVADQEALDPDDPLTWKPCVDLTCRAETTVTPYAIVGCANMGVWQQLSAPEQIENWLRMMQIDYARVAESLLLDRVRAQSKNFSAGTTGNGLWNLLNTLLAYSAANIAAVQRETMEGYVIVAPYGFTEALAADLALRGFSTNPTTADVQRLLRENYGVRIVESYETDNTVAAAFRTGATSLLALADGNVAVAFDQNAHAPDTWPVYLIKPSSFTAGDTSVVDAGYFRDANLVRQNLVRYFWEGFEFLEKQCPDLSFTFNLTTCPNGTASALITAPDCAGTL